MKMILILLFALGVILLAGSSTLFYKDYRNEFEVKHMSMPFLVFGEEELKEIPSLEVDKTNITLPKGFVGKGTSFKWNITYTGAETNLNVEYDIINDTSTEFCVEYLDKDKYIQELTKDLKDTKDIPLTKTNLLSDFTITDTKLDMSKTIEGKQKCFTIEYPKLIENITFKIGWNSVEIDSTAAAIATAFGESENICKDSYGRLHAVWENSANDLAYSNSSDNGITWSSESVLFAGTMEQAGIICDSSDHLTIYYLETSGDDTDILTSTDNGASWVGPTTGADMAPPIEGHSCVLDSVTGGVDTVKCCIKDSQDYLYYIDSSDWNNEIAVNVNSGDDTDYCDIEVGDNGTTYIIGTGSDGDDMDIWSSDIGWGDANRSEIKNEVGVAAGSGVSIAIYNENIYTVGSMGSDLHFCNGTVYDMSSWTCPEPAGVGLGIDGSASYNPDISVSRNNDIYILYASAADNDNEDVLIANSSDKGITWSVRTQYPDTEGSSGFGTVADTNFPEWGRMDGTIHALFTASADTHYQRHKIPSLYKGQLGNHSNVTGVLNNTRFVPGWGVIVNDTTRNGTFISSVVGIGGSYNHTNGTVDTSSWDGYEVEASVRTDNNIPQRNNLIAWFDWNAFKEGDTIVQENTGRFKNDFGINMQFTWGNQNTYEIQNARFGKGLLSHGSGTDSPQGLTTVDNSEISKNFLYNSRNWTVCAWSKTNDSMQVIGYNSVTLGSSGHDDGTHYNIIAKYWNSSGSEFYLWEINNDIFPFNEWVLHCMIRNVTKISIASYSSNYPDGYITTSNPGGTGIINDVDLRNGTTRQGLCTTGVQYDAANQTCDDIFIWNSTLKPSELKQVYDESQYWTSWKTPFQTLSNGVDKVNFSIPQDSKFIQSKFNIYALPSNTTVLYDWNYTFSNLTIAGGPPVGDTCDCTSIQAGTTVDCSENCDITEACDAQGQDITFEGSGEITITAPITNHGKVNVLCNVNCLGGCFEI